MIVEKIVPDNRAPRPLSSAAVKAMLGDGGELTLIDLREELIFSRSHLLWARNVPLEPAGVAFRAAGATQGDAHRAHRRQ